MECRHDWEWDIYRNPREPELYRKRYECRSCGKVKYSNSKNYYVDVYGRRSEPDKQE